MGEIQSLARGIQILNLLALSPTGLGVTEIADRLDITTSTASRLVQTLANYGYTVKNPDTKRYQLGYRVLEMSQVFLNRMPLRNIALPHMERLVDLTGENSHLGIHSDGAVLYIEQVESPAVLRVNAQIGTRAPLHCTALGKVWLAFASIPIPSELSQHTTKTITRLDLLDTELQKIRQDGYAVDNEEYDYDVRCIAVPIFGHKQQVIASLGISGPVSRIAKDRIPEFASHVLHIGQSLSKEMGYGPKI